MKKFGTLFFFLTFFLFIFCSGCQVEITPLSPTPTLVPGNYELVLSMDVNGNVIAGSWSEAVKRVTGQMENCLLRFDNRLAKPLHIEYATNYLRFDFQPLHAYYNSSDVYAFVQLEPTVKAGLGTSVRYGQVDKIWLTDTAQSPDSNNWKAMKIDLYCEKASQYKHLASFNTAGVVSSGSWDALYQAVIYRSANAKVRFGGNRIIYVPHIEFGPDWINFDTIGLNAPHNTWEAYTYARVVQNQKAGIGTSLRRGYSSPAAGPGPYVYLKDREQYNESVWQAIPLEIYGEDIFSQEFVISSSGTMVKGTWDDLYEQVIYQVQDVKLRYDNRISEPDCIEYSGNSLQFELTNLHAYHDGWDAFALINLDHGNSAGLQACYRRGNYALVYKKSVENHSMQVNIPLTIVIRCKEKSNYHHLMSLQATGLESLGNFSDFFTDLTDSRTAYVYKLRQSNRITKPLLIEYSGEANPLYFDYHSLTAASVGTWEAFGLTFVQYGQPSGLTGSYRKGDINVVSAKGRDQNVLAPLAATDIDFFCY